MNKLNLGLCKVLALVITSILVVWGVHPANRPGEEQKETKAKPRSGDLQCGDTQKSTPKDAHRTVQVKNTGRACDVKVTVECDGGNPPDPFTVTPGATSPNKDCAEGKHVKTVKFECLTSTKPQDCKYEWSLLN